MKWKRNKRGPSLKINSKIVSLLLFILILGISFFLFSSSIFKIKIVDVSTQNISCVSQNQIRDLVNLLGQNIFFVNDKKVEGDLKGKYICIKSVTTSRNFPDKIKLQTIGREAVLTLSVSPKQATNSGKLKDFLEASPSANFTFQSEDEEIFLMDSEGIIYSKENANATKVYLSGKKIELGQKANKDLVDTLIILTKIKTFGINIKEADIFDELLLINNAPKIIFSLNKNIDTQTASLQLILEKAKIDASDLEFIDLRFDKPVVKIAPKKDDGKR